DVVDAADVDPLRFGVGGGRRAYGGSVVGRHGDGRGGHSYPSAVANASPGTRIAFSDHVAGRCWSRSGTLTTLGSAASVLMKARNCRLVSASPIAVFHSHW